MEIIRSEWFEHPGIKEKYLNAKLSKRDDTTNWIWGENNVYYYLRHTQCTCVSMYYSVLASNELDVYYQTFICPLLDVLIEENQ